VNAPCRSDPCQGESTCIDLTSSSSAGSRYRCECAPGRTGTNCELLQLEPCHPSPCLNGAACTSVANGTDYRCRCAAGYQGRDCEWHNPCLAADPPCRNGATCRSPISGQYSCMCASGQCAAVSLALYLSHKFILLLLLASITPPRSYSVFYFFLLFLLCTLCTISS